VCTITPYANGIGDRVLASGDMYSVVNIRGILWETLGDRGGYKRERGLEMTMGSKGNGTDQNFQTGRKREGLNHCKMEGDQRLGRGENPASVMPSPK